MRVMPFFRIRTVIGGSFVLLAGWLGITPHSETFAQEIRVNEIMYHPAGAGSLEQWFELYNASTNNVNLSGWQAGKAVSFTFAANTLLNAGDYLVVAADRSAFSQQYPAVTNVVAGWTGRLSHDGEEIRIVDASGNTVNSVSFAAEGDWALRRLGVVDQFNRQGWEWFAEHDGGGKSLELMNGDLPNSHGQNWGASSTANGTPGRANSISRANVAPLILDVAHFPVVPRSSDSVTITARLVDERSSEITAMLHWRRDGFPEFSASALLDDGAHNDGLANDGLFGFVLPAQANGSVIEFFLTARDSENNSRTYPNVISSGGARTANLAFQVDDSAYAGNQPLFRLVMTRAEYDYLSNEIWESEPDSDALVNGTFISTDGVLDAGTTTQFRYTCGFRNRGHGTRTSIPHNFHVSIPRDRLWKDRAGINLNSHYTHSQTLGSAVFRRLGIPMADSRPAQARINGANLASPGQDQFGSYAANELMDGELVNRQFPLDDGGNLYRGIRDRFPGNPKADLAWHGPSYASYTNAYFKENNKTLNDWSDLLHLLDVLNNSGDGDYPRMVSDVVNVEEWMRYFAVNTLFDNQETSLATGYGDDYAMYRGELDRRFLLLPYDLDSVMGRGTTVTSGRTGLFRMIGEGTSHYIPVLERFVKHPEFAPIYYRELMGLAETMFSPEKMNPLLDQVLGSFVDAGTLATMKAFNSNHVGYVKSQIPLGLSASHNLTVVNGYPRTSLPTVVLHGLAGAIETRSVLVNGSAAEWTAWKGAWTNGNITLRPGLNRILVQALGVGGVEVGRTNIGVWFDDGSVATSGGVISADTTWTVAGGPYSVNSSLIVNSGATLTIEAGATVYLGLSADLTVASGGRILAEGTATLPILFTRAPGTGATWGGITINGGAGTPETRIAYVHFEFNNTTAIHASGATLFLDHLTFGTQSEPYLSLDESSFVVQDCIFPSATSEFELIHGAGGIKPGGRGIIQRCFFGVPIGYNDVVDFTGGNRPGPIVQFIDNVFVGGSDDLLDLDGTDAWVEGNIFLHVHRNGSPDSASAISGGDDGGNTSEITIIGNIFYDCDQAVTAKQGNFYTLINNTMVHQTHVGSQDAFTAVVNLGDDGTSLGAGLYLEGNIIYDAEALARNYQPGASVLTFNNNLMPFAWPGPGAGNSSADPRLKHIPMLSETFFATFEQARIMWDWFTLLPGSPGRGTGPNGRDMGGVIPMGASIFGEPAGVTDSASATLDVGIVRGGNGIPASGWPSGSGFTHYKYRFDDGPWSTERVIATPIALASLANGVHRVEVSGKRDSGYYQDNPVFGTDALVARSRAWTVDSSYVPPMQPSVRLNEVMSKNQAGNPDLIELYNFGSTSVDLSGMGLTDNRSLPQKFSFPQNTILAPGAFLVLFADDLFSAPGIHTGFGLKQSGDDVYLYDKLASGGKLLDSVQFGPQLANYSIGRGGEGVWTLCQPTFGASNFVQACGNLVSLRINEWLADAQFSADNDFVELFNPDLLPIALEGCFFSDAAGSPGRHRIANLSFIAGRGFQSFIADGDPGGGADHLNFKLSPEVGIILLLTPDLTMIDVVNYASQRTDFSEGRSPNGSDTLTTFSHPTSGGPNTGSTAGDCTLATLSVPLLPMDAKWRYNQTANLDGIPWQAPDYDDSAWPVGTGLLAVENCDCLPVPGIGTALNIGRSTYYFRTQFVMNTNLAGFNLNLTSMIDDGAVVHLNGIRILTNGMGSGAINYSTFASRNVSNARAEFFSLSGGALIHGTNVLAVEVHQTDLGSTDIVFGMALEAARTETNCEPASAIAVALNEILAGSFTNLAGNAAQDWVEILNYGTNSVDLSDSSLTDDSSFARKFVFPSGSSLPAGGSLVIFFNPDQPASGNNAGFGLNERGGAVFLFNNSGNGGSLLDGLTYGLQVSGYAIGRVPNGTGAWGLTVPTMGEMNTAAGLGSPSFLRINEWMADPIGGSDWFEIFNSGVQPVALGGLFLTDDLADRTRSGIPPLSFIGSGTNGFIQFFADSAQMGSDHVDFSLKKAGEQLGIFSSSGVLLDGIAFGAQLTGASQGHFPDGSGGIFSFIETISPGARNSLGHADFDRDGLEDDWEVASFGTLARDGTGDFDHDGVTDFREYVGGTDPTNPASYLRIDAINVGTGHCIIGFTAVAGETYSVQFRDDLAAGSWGTLTNLPPFLSTGPAEVTDPNAGEGPSRFYRLISPGLQ